MGWRTHAEHDKGREVLVALRPSDRRVPYPLASQRPTRTVWRVPPGGLRAWCRPAYWQERVRASEALQRTRTIILGTVSFAGFLIAIFAAIGVV